MLTTIIAQAAQALHTYFDPIQTNQVARRVGWMQRTSKMDGFQFLKVLVMGFIKHPCASLNQLSQISQDLGVPISPQGIDERLTETAVCFLKERLSGILSNLQAKRRTVAEVLDHFTEVYLQDSTVQSLPKGLQDLFPGAGGNASSAAVKIQLLFAYMSGNLAHLAFETGRSPDASYCAHLPHLLPGSLLIQDLGFFNLELLRQVDEQSVGFITRWRQDVQVYFAATPDHALNMPTFLRTQTQTADSYEVLIGYKARLPLRLVCVHLPDRIAAQRRRRLKSDSKRRGKNLTLRALALCQWNVFLTNLPENFLSIHQVLACYALRWQIELIFKLWKSQAALKHLAGLRRERVLCELYAKMIGLVLSHFLVAPLRFYLIDNHLELSPPKARQVLEDRVSFLAPLLGVRLLDLTIELQELSNRILRFARKNRRKTHPSSLDRLLMANHYDISCLFPLA